MKALFANTEKNYSKFIFVVLFVVCLAQTKTSYCGGETWTFKIYSNLPTYDAYFWSEADMGNNYDTLYFQNVTDSVQFHFYSSGYPMFTMTWIEIKRNGLPYSSHHVSNGFRYAITEDGVYDVYASAYPTYIYARLYISFSQPILPIKTPEEAEIKANLSSSGHLVLKHLPHLEEGQLEVYDLFGRLIVSEAIPTRQSEYVSYKSLSTLAPQIFLWRVSAEGKTQAQSKIMRL